MKTLYEGREAPAHEPPRAREPTQAAAKSSLHDVRSCASGEARTERHDVDALRARKLETLGALAGNIAQDFHHALQLITGNTALARHCLAPDHPAHAYLTEVAGAGSRASDLVRRILTFSSRGTEQRERLAMHSVVGEALRLAAPTLPAQVGLRARLPDDLPDVIGDAAQIHQIVVHLVSNAAHAIGAANGSIEVSLHSAEVDGSAAAAPGLVPGRYLVLRLGDDGVGMAESTLVHVFDPFFTTKPAGQGTGLGLSMVQGIMKSLGGAVQVQSELGTGTTVSLFFPTAQTLEVPPPRERADSAELGPRVLFVDDEDVLVTLGTHMLEVLGYRSTGTHLPLDALRAFAANPGDFDAVVTDVSMPGLSGLQLAQQLLALRPDLPIVMMSGSVGPEELSQSRKLGIRELLLKPVGIDELHRSLARVLAQAGPALRRSGSVHKT
jgi:signal transduction histidine kinase/ActR/RegA family two-component response regulator